MAQKEHPEATRGKAERQVKRGCKAESKDGPASRLKGSVQNVNPGVAPSRICVEADTEADREGDDHDEEVGRGK